MQINRTRVMKNSDISLPDNLIITKVVQVIQDQLKLEHDTQINCAASLQDLGLDSLDMVELVIKLEDLFKKQISDEQAQLFLKPVDIVNYFSC